MTVFFVKYHLLFDHSFWSKSSLKVLLTILLLSRLIIFSTIDWMRNRELMNFWLIILNILLTRWLLVLICSLKLNLTQMIPSFLLLRVFVILLVRLMKTCLIRISLLLVLLCFHLAVPEFSAHATLYCSSSQSSGYSNINRLSNEMLERLVISLSYLIHVFLKYQEWIDSCAFNPIYHPLGNVTYYLGYNFVTSQRPTSKGLVCY